MRLRALMNLPRDNGEDLISHHLGHMGGVGRGGDVKAKLPRGVSEQMYQAWGTSPLWLRSLGITWGLVTTGSMGRMYEKLSKSTRFEQRKEELWSQSPNSDWDL